MSRKIYLICLLTAICAYAQIAVAEIRVGIEVHNTSIPVLVNRPYNIVAEICIDNASSQPQTVNSVELKLSSEFSNKAFSSVRLMYTGGMSALTWRSSSWAMKDQAKRLGGSQSLYCSPDYAMECALISGVSTEKINLNTDRKLVVGKNYFYISLSIDSTMITNLSQTFSAEISAIEINNSAMPFTSDRLHTQRLGYGVRQSGDDGVYCYRIPGLITSLKGSLIGVYDVRYHTNLDLQDDIDIGVSRSTDGGQTWNKMQVIMDMGTWGGLPEAQNGIGDPSILIDNTTGEIFVVAVWTHGLGNSRAWGLVGNGLDPLTTAQLMITSSTDDGCTWSEPRNITSQVKDPSWTFTLQGPGRGITMSNGTLVFPIQYIDSTGIPNAAIMYSSDHGKSWKTNNYAKSNTTESQVVELEPGCLMLNMRDNRKIGRAIYTTRDMGCTWTEHHTSGGTLREPVCMASLLNVKASENILGRDVLLFANPDTTGVRSRLSIKASVDNGDTWLKEHQLLLDEDLNWGYSCLTMIDRETIGIIYEGSTAQMVFQAIKLRDIVCSDEKMLTWRKIDPIDPIDKGLSQGVSALYAGVLGNDLLVAGGANFPDVPAAEGGRKMFYDGIYLLKKCDGNSPKWQKVGKLPKPLAYGVTISVDQHTLVLVGGSNANGSQSDVLMLRSANGKMRVTALPSLPIGLEQCAGSVINNVIYITGGVSGGKPSAELFVYDINSKLPKWVRQTAIPEAMVQPVAVASGGELYVWGGFCPYTPNSKTVVMDYGYKFNPQTDNWSRISGVGSDHTFTGATATITDSGKILCSGGVNAPIFISSIERREQINIATAAEDTVAVAKLQEEELEYMQKAPNRYKFDNNLYLYNTNSDKWSPLIQSEHFARAGSAMVFHKGKLFIINGERQPGRRVADVWSLETQIDVD